MSKKFSPGGKFIYLSKTLLLFILGVIRESLREIGRERESVRKREGRARERASKSLTDNVCQCGSLALEKEIEK